MESLAHGQYSSSSTTSPEARIAALSQLEQKASTLRQSSSNNFLVALEGLMLSAIAWESIGKVGKPIISGLSKVTTAIGLVVTVLFSYNALRDRAKAEKADRKLQEFGYEELSLPFEKQQAPVIRIDQPVAVIQTADAQIESLQTPSQHIVR